MQPIKRVFTAVMAFELMVIIIAGACGQTTPTATQAISQTSPTATQAISQASPTETSTQVQSGGTTNGDDMTPEQLCQCESDAVTNIIFPQEFQYDKNNIGPGFVSEELVWRAPITYNPSTQMCEGEFAYHLCYINSDNGTNCYDKPWQDTYHDARSYVQHTLDEAKSYCKLLNP